MSSSLKGLVGLVTGGGGVLGGATIRHLLRSQCKISCFDIKEPAQYKDPFKDASLEQLLLGQGDVTSEKDVSACLDTIRSRFGRLDFVINCAGFGGAIRFLKPFSRGLNCEVFSQSLMTLASGTFNVCRLAAPLIGETLIDGADEAGVIINVSSFFAYEGNVAQLPYVAPKAAIRAMTVPMSRDLAPLKIRVVCVSPGLFDTPLVFKDEKPGQAYQYICSLNLTHKKLLPPEGFADTVSGIIVNPMLNGCNLRVDDGARMIFM